jgi:hypothetical protein
MSAAGVPSSRGFRVLGWERIECCEVVPKKLLKETLPYAVGSRAAAPRKPGFGLLGRSAAERAEEICERHSVYVTPFAPQRYEAPILCREGRDDGVMAGQALFVAFLATEEDNCARHLWEFILALPHNPS